MKVLNSQQTRELEQAAVDAGVSYLELMENAGSAAARFLCRKYHVEHKRVVILCGKGNNGGDGYVAARRLAKEGAQVSVILVEGLPKTEIAAHMLALIRDVDIRIVMKEDMEAVRRLIMAADFIVDAIYGIGFHGSVPESMHEIFDLVGRAGADVIAFDIPSGVICDTGAVEGDCIKAKYTVTFSTLKTGHLLFPAKEYCGELYTASVGIPSQLIKKQPCSMYVTEEETIADLFRPRKEETNKGTYGTLLMYCGSEGMVGAAVMAASAAYRTGVGLVHMAIPRELYPIAANHLVEPVYILLDPGAETGQLRGSFQKATAILAGCGLGSSRQAKESIHFLLRESSVPIVLDADGINLVAEHIDILKTAKVPIVMTPHPGEMARLMGTTVKDVQAHRLEYAKKFAAQYQVVLVLKGSGTMVAHPNGTVCYNPTGNPGMAVGGSGDVLAGMIASLLAQGHDAYLSAVGGVYLHGMAGDLCAKRFSQRAMLPTDIIGQLPELFLQFEQ